MYKKFKTCRNKIISLSLIFKVAIWHTSRNQKETWSETVIVKNTKHFINLFLFENLIFFPFVKPTISLKRRRVTLSSCSKKCFITNASKAYIYFALRNSKLHLKYFYSLSTGEKKHKNKLFFYCSRSCLERWNVGRDVFSLVESIKLKSCTRKKWMRRMLKLFGNNIEIGKS